MIGRAWSAVLAACLLLPVVAAALTVVPGVPWAGPTSEGTGPFAYVIGLYGAYWVRSAGLAVGVAVCALAVGAPAGIALGRSGSRGLGAWLSTPLVVPGIALAVGIVALYGALRGLLLLAAAHVLVVLPLVVRTVAAAAHGADLDSLLEQGRVLGLGRAQAWWRVGVPLLRRALLASLLMAAAVSWGEFNVTFLLATPEKATFPAALYLAFTTNSLPVGGAALLLFLLPVVPLAWLAQAVGGEARQQA